ncbi:MAG: hypothetical protein AAF614_26975 [Chloroflexota bacterium]
MSKLDIKQIIKGFYDRTLPKEEWTHQAHLVIGLDSILNIGLEESMPPIREGIKGYNVASGTPNTDTGGYHETITIFFLHALQAFVAQNGDVGGLEELVERLEESLLTKRPFIFNFYNKELLFTVHARHNWVEPNIQPLSALAEMVLYPEAVAV